MRIALERSGGFAGVTFHSEVDTAKLPPEEAREWEALVGRADLRGLAAAAPERRMPDAFQYDLTLEEGGKRTHVTVGDSALTPPAQQLVQRLLERARG